MAVTSEQVRQEYGPGDNAQTVFQIPFMFHEPDRFLVYRIVIATGAETLLTYLTDYTVTGEHVGTGGQVTLTTPLLSTENLLIIHDPKLDQDLVLVAGAAFPIVAFERQLDEMVHQNQRTRDLVLRAMTLSDFNDFEWDAQGARIINVADPIAGQDAATKAYVLSQTIVSAVPGPGSLTNAMWDPGDPLELTNVDGMSIAQQQAEVNPLALADSATLLEQLQKIQFQLLAILNNLDAGARTHAYQAVGTDVPTQIASAIAAITGSAPNALYNAGFSVHQRQRAFPFAVADGVDSFVWDRWFVKPTDGNVTVQEQGITLAGPRSFRGAQINGGAGVTSVWLGQRLGFRTIESLYAGLQHETPIMLTFGCWIWHVGSTGTVTPELIVRTTNAGGDDDTLNSKFATANVTTRLTVPMPAVSPSDLIAFTHTFDVSLLTDFEGGLEIIINLGALNAGTVQLIVSDPFLAAGDIQAAWLAPEFDRELERCRRYYQKTFDYEVAPQDGTTEVSGLVMTGGSGGAGYAFGWPHNPTMRGRPSIVTYQPVSGGVAGRAHNQAGDSASATGAGGQVSASTSRIFFTPDGALDRWWIVDAVADAEWYD